MVRLLLWFTLFGSVPVIMYAQADSDAPASEDESSAEPVENAESVPAPTEDSENKASTPEKKIFAAIEGELHRYKTDNNDSTALRNKKNRKFVALAASINKRYAGKTLAFQRMCVSDVQPETDLTAYGKKRAKDIISQLRRTPEGRALYDSMGSFEENFLLKFYVGLALAGCKKCYRETGRFEVRFAHCPDGDYSGSATMGSFVEKLVNSESEALRYEKDRAYPVSGTVRAIKFEDGLQGVETKIFLK